MSGRDLRYAARLLRRTPVFSGVATVVLAVAVAVATAVFSLYSHLALQPIPGVQGGDRLVSIGLARDANEWIPFSAAQFRAVSDTLSVPEALVAAATLRRTVEVDGASGEATVAGVSPGFLRDLGVRILLGADLDAASADPDARNAVISEHFWREWFDGRASAIGASVTIDDEAFTVVGVTGAGFAGLRRGALRDDLWIPAGAALATSGPRMFGMTDEQRRQMTQTMPFFRVTARLPAGADAARLQQELDLVWPRVRDAQDTAVSNALMRMEALPGTAANPREYLTLVRQSQLLVGGAVLVLLVASLNLASFFLARGPGRMAELRTRLAIGASRPAIVRQLFVESAVLIVVATALGLLLHFWLRTLLVRLPPFVDMPYLLAEAPTDWRVFAFIIGAALAVTLVAGLLPAVSIALRTSLTVAAPTVLGSRARNLQPLLVLQVAVATVVVLAGALFVGELQRLERAPTGFDGTGVSSGRVTPEPGAMRGGRLRMQSDAAQMERFVHELDTRVAAVDGVDAFAFASAVPFSAPPANPGVVELVGVVDQPPEDRRRAYHNRTSPDFFRVLAPRFVHGRPFDGNDPLEVVVSQALAMQLWGRDDVVGERLMQAEGGAAVGARGGVMMSFRQGADGAPLPRDVFTVVGVVEDMRYAGAEDEYPPMLYRPWAGPLFGQSYLFRGRVEPAIVHALVDEAVRAQFSPLHAEAPVSMRSAVRDALRTERARGRLAAGAALIALLLTTVGLYASMQHMVEARRSELALRKAIGADDRTVIAMVLKRALAITGAGVAVAAGLSVIGASRMSALLFGLDPLGPRAWALALVLVGVTGVAAAWLPARRAGRVDPAIALRYE